jgi:hypothetical protein
MVPGSYKEKLMICQVYLDIDKDSSEEDLLAILSHLRIIQGIYIPPGREKLPASLETIADILDQGRPTVKSPYIARAKKDVS